MKRVLMSLVASIAIVAATDTKADIFVAWQGSGGFYANGTAGAFPADGINNFNGGSTIVMLIWTPTASIDPVDPFDIAGNYTGGDDLFLASYTINSPPSTSFGEYVAPGATYSNLTYGQTLENGFVYARVFEDGSPAGGETYYDSTTVDALLFTGSEVTPVEHNANIATGDELNQVIVPEPTTLAFVGIGSILVALRRSKS